MDRKLNAAVRTIGALAATLATATVLAAPGAGDISQGQARRDTRLAAEVSAHLKADPDFFFRHVNVSVNDDVARLGGYVWTADALYRAEAIARETPGITGVIDHMRLERDNGSDPSSQ
jgi:osmotically-inducible protein OsmY